MDLIRNFKFNKRFGQNFIFDTNLLTAIVKDSGVTKQDDVLEIGPGAGTLTKIIAQNCKKVVSYEIDTNLQTILEDNLKGVKNSKVVFRDALKTDISEIESDFENNYKIIANLPYYITTPLIFKFIEQTKKIDSITVMVQKEVAERFSAKPNSKEYGSISVFLQYNYDISKVTLVSKNSFYPVPKVDSMVIKFKHKENKMKPLNEEKFYKLIKNSFKFKRKNLKNNLKEYNLDKINDVLKKYGKDLTVRAESLTVDEFIDISNSL